MTKQLQELIDELNALESMGNWEDAMPYELWEKHFKDKSCIVAGLDVEKHRHFEISTTVFSIGDEFLGCRAVSNVYSEAMGIEDCCVQVEFFEMEKIQTITYRKKEVGEPND